MPILSDDIKILKSAVMADVAEGGGAMTGTALVDGQSNNLFPDTSSMDRALGDVALRKVFGVAHSDDTDALMGAHAIITDAPDDPLVHCTLLRTPGWADTRTVAQDAVEKYLVKGPRLTYRLWETHYSGALQMRLISMVGGTPPAGGDAVVLRNPNGAEQYVRILRVSTASQAVAVIEGGATVLVNATVATCELGNALEHDFLGPPALRVGLVEANFAQVYSTNISAGARFYGVKPLLLDAEPGDYTVTTTGGIYTPVVPAATVESALVDIAPLTTRQSLNRTAQDLLNLPAQTLTLQAGAVLRLPTAVQPGSVIITHGSTVFTDDGAGALLQGSTTVGAVDYRGKTATMAGSSPNYGSAIVVISYSPATPSGAATHSAALTITSGNQGLVYTQAFEPPPAPGTLTVSYMAQGRWYDLQDNGNGKVSGAESAYGAGTVSYSTGSAAVTLGAIPDVDSPLIYTWGDAATAVAVAPEDLPARLTASIPIDPRVIPDSVELAWSRGGNDYAATVSSTGVISGDAAGQLTPGELLFSPAVLPAGDVSISYERGPDSASTATNSGGGNYATALTPVRPGSVRLVMMVVPQSGFDLPSSITVTDDATGVLKSATPGSVGQAVGTIDYTTGAVALSNSVAMTVYENVVQSYPIGSGTGYFEKKVVRTAHTVALQHATVSSIYHSRSGTVEVDTVIAVLTWRLALPVLAGLTLRTDALAFAVGGTPYTSQAGSLTAGWDAVTGSGTAAGAVTSGGVITVTTLPASGNNAVSWANAAQDKSAKKVGQGVFRVESAPLKAGVFQIQAGALVGGASEGGTISGGGWSGTVDFQRGVVRWNRVGSVGGVWVGGWETWQVTLPVAADELTYNAVFLQYLPLDKTLLGLDTVRLQLDGKVPIFRVGDLVVVHNTLPTQLPNPLTKGDVYDLGRERIASVRVKDALGAVVPSSLYQAALDAGEFVVPVETDLTPYTQPLTVEHRIEDMLLCSQADISGQLKFTRSITHNFPAGTSYVSSALPFGDLFSRAFGYFEQATWTGVWSESLIGDAPSAANFNEGAYPVVTTNRGAIEERWALIFTSTTAFRIVGETVGEIGTGNTASVCAPNNPAAGAPFWTLDPLAFGGGWSVGNVIRFNTAACGAPFWLVRTVLQGPATLDSDVFSIAFRGDVDRP
jgi:hypothetical protein